MTTALVGSTGFVGGTIARQRRVDAAFHRTDIDKIRGQRFSTLWISGAPAQKWLANSDPEVDDAGLRLLMEHLRHVEAEQVVLISTVDVYRSPSGVDEETVVDPQEHPEPYGRHRLWLEQSVRALHPHALVVRLPALFGAGLKKNLLYDLLHDREEFAHRDSVFQFYDLRRLCDDVDRALAADLRLVNFATEPLSAHAIATEVFERDLVNRTGTPVAYDMQTVHAASFDRPGTRYLANASSVVDAIATFVAEQRSGAPCGSP